MQTSIQSELTAGTTCSIAATHIENSQMYKGEDEAPTKEADAVFGGSVRAAFDPKRTCVSKLTKDTLSSAFALLQQDAGSFRPINRTRMRRSSVNAVIEEDEEVSARVHTCLALKTKHQFPCDCEIGISEG